MEWIIHMDSLYYLIKRLSHFQKKYPHRPRYCALRMVITSVHALFMSSYTGTKKLFYRKNQVPCIVFSISGGLGDFLLGLNLVYHVYLYLMDSPVQIKIHFHSSIVLKSFCKNMPWIAQSSTSLRSLHGDLLVEIRNFPCIINMDKKKVKNYGVKLQKLISLWKNFYIHNRKYFDYSPQLDSLGHIHGQISGSKRINEGDIGGLLNMKFLPEFFQTKNGMNKFENFLRAFVDLKVPHIQFNVVRREDLQDAKIHPQLHKSLTIRVAGYTAYFVELAHKLQDEIIERTTYDNI